MLLTNFLKADHDLWDCKDWPDGYRVLFEFLSFIGGQKLKTQNSKLKTPPTVSKQKLGSLKNFK